MHKFKKIIFTLIIFLLTTISVDAASTCGVQEKSELNKEVANIKVNYELFEDRMKVDGLITSDEVDDDEDLTIGISYFKVNIINLSSKFYAVVTNDVNSETMTYTSSNANQDGIVTFDWKIKYTITNFKIKIYASSETGCQGDEYKTLYLTTPRYNEYSSYALCNLIPDYYLCQKYVTYVDNINFSTFIDKTNKEIEKRNNENSDNSGDNGDDDGVINNTVSFIKKHKMSFIIGGIVIVVVAIGTTFIIIRKRRRDEV